MADFEMRVQFQDHESGRKDNTLGESVAAKSDPGVTVKQVHDALDRLLTEMPKVKWIGKAYHKPFEDAVRRVKKKVSGLPPNGFYGKAGNLKALQEKFPGDGKVEYRVDVENLRGHNLRE